MADTQTAAPKKALTLEQARENLAALEQENNSLPREIAAAAAAYDAPEITRLRRRAAEVADAIPSARIVKSLLQQQEYERVHAELTAESKRLEPLVLRAERAERAATEEKNELFNQCRSALYRAREYNQYIAQEKMQRSQLLRQMQGQEADRALRVPLQNPMFG